MGSSILGELLILFLLILNCSRMFFLRYGKVDSLTILAPVCLFLSIIQILAWNADIFSIALLIISLFSFFTNFRALLRFSSGLYIDHYSIAFKFGAALVLFFSIVELVVLIYFYPVTMIPSKYGVEKEVIRVTGTFNGSFDRSKKFALSNGLIYKYENIDSSKKLPEEIILISDKRGDSSAYVPLMIKLAEKGYTVYTGDFYAKDVRWIHNFFDVRFFRNLAMIFDYAKNPVQFNAQKEFYSYNSKREIDALVKFVEKENKVEDGKKLFIIGDWMSEIALSDYQKENPEKLFGVMKLSEQEEYKTPGFGFIQLTNPSVAFLLKFPKDRNTGCIDLIAEKIISLLPYHAPAVSESEIEDISENEEILENSDETHEDFLQDVSKKSENVKENSKSKI